MAKKDGKKGVQDQTAAEDQSSTIEPVEKNIQESLPEVAEETEEKPIKIASKQYVKKLKEEFKTEKISESVYTAFLASVPKVDWEKNYRLIWDTTFKRPPIKK